MSLEAIGIGLSTFFASPAGGQAVLGLAGKVIGGIGSAMFARSEQKAEEKAKIAEEQRQEARYAGVGNAAQFKGINTSATAQTQQRVDPHKSSTTPLGQPEPKKMIGQQYSGAGKFTYDPNKQKIIYA